MAKKKKDRLRVHKEARRLARLGVGMPPTERTIPDKRQKAPKHKKKLVAAGFELEAASNTSIAIVELLGFRG